MSDPQVRVGLVAGGLGASWPRFPVPLPLGYLEHERAWARIGRWVRAASVRAARCRGRHGLTGHLYPGMLGVSTDLTLVTADFGGHVERRESDDLAAHRAGRAAAESACSAPHWPC